MQFDGCGVTNGCLGVLLMAGLREEAALVTQRVEELIAKGHRVSVNALGQSRGGVAGIFLAQALATIDQPAMCLLSLLLFDPVPGPKWDPINSVWARDLTACASLRRCVALYPHCDLILHTPVFCDYPATAEVEEDVWLGCHVGALMMPRRAGPQQLRHPLPAEDSYGQNVLASNLSFRRIHDFMVEAGTVFASLDREFPFQPTEKECLEYCRGAFAGERFVASRWVIDGRGLGRVIVRNGDGDYLNKYHRYLEHKLDREGGLEGEVPEGQQKPVEGDLVMDAEAAMESQRAIGNAAYILDAPVRGWGCAIA